MTAKLINYPAFLDIYPKQPRNEYVVIDMVPHILT